MIVYTAHEVYLEDITILVKCFSWNVFKADVFIVRVCVVSFLAVVHWIGLKGDVGEDQR